jgi:50S ribosomal protein L16 3-hydroxylase
MTIVAPVSDTPSSASLASPLSPAQRVDLRAAWAQRPMVLQGPFAGVFPPLDAGFSAAVAEADAFRGGKIDPTLRLFIEHDDLARSRKLPPRYSSLMDFDAFLPAASDESFDGYVARVSRSLGGRRFGLFSGLTHTHDYGFWCGLRPFLRDLSDVVGLPLGGWQFQMLVGNYRSTPFGIHKDEQAVLTYVARRNKRFLLWPLDYFAHRRDLPVDIHHMEAVKWSLTFADPLEYQRACEDAIVVDAREGDLVYWPASYWHIAVSASEEDSELPVITMGWGAFVNTTPFAGLAGMLLPAQAWPTTCGADGIRGGPQRPPAFTAALFRNLATPSRKAQARHVTLVSWLKRMSALGCIGVPAPRSTPMLVSQDVLRRCEDVPILWLRLPRNALAVAANGHATVIRGGPALLASATRTLEVLHAGERLEVRPLLERGGPDLIDLVRVLMSWRALRRS